MAGLRIISSPTFFNEVSRKLRRRGAVLKSESSQFCVLFKHLKAFVEPLMPSEKTQENIRFRESDQIWVLAYHQLFLFILVAGRAVMPRNGSYWIILSGYVHHTV